ncbi:dihydropteroate synthase [Shigella flexneri]
MIPVVEAIAQRFEVWISVDTSRPEVIRESARVRAHTINDIRSLSEPGALERRRNPGCRCRLNARAGQSKNQ